MSLFDEKLLKALVQQTHRQVVTSSHKLNLQTDLCWVAKWTRKFPPKFMQYTEKPINFSFSVTLRERNNKWTSLNLRWIGLFRWPNGEKLAWLLHANLILIKMSASCCKSMQVHPKLGHGVAGRLVDPSS